MMQVYRYLDTDTVSVFHRDPATDEETVTTNNPWASIREPQRTVDTFDSLAVVFLWSATQHDPAWVKIAEY